eukprot:2413-Heterococcus_DN1.PRE.1
MRYRCTAATLLLRYFATIAACCSCCCCYCYRHTCELTAVQLAIAKPHIVVHYDTVHHPLHSSQKLSPYVAQHVIAKVEYQQYSGVRCVEEQLGTLRQSTIQHNSSARLKTTGTTYCMTAHHHAPITLVRTTVDVNREPLAVACRALLCGRALSTALALLSESAFCSLHTVLPAALSAAAAPLPASMSSAVQQTAILASSARASCIKGSLRAAAATASGAGEANKEGAGDTPLVDAPPGDAPIGGTP